MRTSINYCINCGDQYKFQWSGNYDAVPEIPKEYRNEYYCPECQKAIFEALKPIEKKSEITWIDCTDLSLLDDLESEFKIIHQTPKDGSFPLMKRVFMSPFNTTLNEHKRIEEVKYKGRTYVYSYYPSERNNALINTKVRVSLKTKEILEYL